jgi:hypothetical protein
MAPQVQSKFSNIVNGDLGLLFSAAGTGAACALAAGTLAIPVANIATATGCALAAVQLAFEIDTFLFSNAANDPPDPNFQKVFVPTIETSPVPLTTGCMDLAGLDQSIPYAVDQASEWLNALNVTANRYGTALGNNDIVSANLQYGVFQNYLSSYRTAASAVSSDLTCLANFLVVPEEGFRSQIVQEQVNAISFLATQGASSPFLIDVLQPLGLTAADIQNSIRDVLSAPPALSTMTPNAALVVAAQDFQAIAAVPEPSTVILVGSTLLGFLVIVSKRSSRDTAPTGEGDAIFLDPVGKSTIRGGDGVRPQLNRPSIMQAITVEESARSTCQSQIRKPQEQCIG